MRKTALPRDLKTGVSRRTSGGILTLLAALLLILPACFGHARAEDPGRTVSDVTRLRDNSFSCVFDGVKHIFVLDLPAKTAGAPLVIMLPGYGNTAESFRNTARFQEQAVPAGYAVAWVTGAPNPNDPVSAVGWNSGIAAAGNDDTAFLKSLAAYLCGEYSLDGRRVFAAGFSNGAFMAHRLAMEAGDTFAACVSVAGLMPVKIWEARNETNEVSFFQITGEMDDVVPKNSDASVKYVKDPAIEDVMAYWAESDGLDRCESAETGKGSVLTRCRSAEKPDQVWHLVVKNGRHSWPAERTVGVDANRLILEFLEAVSAEPSAPDYN